MSQKPDDPRLVARKKRQAAALKANMKKRKEAGKDEPKKEAEADD